EQLTVGCAAESGLLVAPEFVLLSNPQLTAPLLSPRASLAACAAGSNPGRTAQLRDTPTVQNSPDLQNRWSARATSRTPAEPHLRRRFQNQSVAMPRNMPGRAAP